MDSQIQDLNVSLNGESIYKSLSSFKKKNLFLVLQVNPWFLDDTVVQMD